MTVTHTHASATDKQIQYAQALMRKKGFRFLSDAEKACFGKRHINGMDRGKLSTLIDFLKR